MNVKVQLVGYTTFVLPEDPKWDTDAGGGQALAEFAGRACYQSWSKPNPETATNAGYLNHILDVGHLSVLEHGSVSFYITGVSRSLTHELVRHRHFAYSQLSQRYVDESKAEMITPPELEDNEILARELEYVTTVTSTAYKEIVYHITNKLKTTGVTGIEARKRARQAARAVLPNMTETKIVVTGNYRAWMHFITMRAAAAADVEIRRLAIEILRQLQLVAPNVFEHYEIFTLDDGTLAAKGPVA